jgi:hypothetical protein
LKNFVDNLPENKIYGTLLVTNNQNNLIIKFWYLLFSLIIIKTIKRRLSAISGPILGYYGIYPQNHNPVAIYQLNTRAGTYANEYILPPSKGLKSILSRCMIHITAYHPATSGIIFIFTKK